MKTFALTFIVLALSFLTGCSGGGGAGTDTAEVIAKDMIANMKEMGAIMNSITDEASAKAAVPKIDAVRAKMRGCRDRAQKAPKLSGAEEQKFNAQMESGMQEAMAVLGPARARLMTQPELMAIIEPALQGMEDDL